MPNIETAAARHARDRNVFPHDGAPGPYEAAYDVRRGYDEPLRAASRVRERPETLQFRGRGEDR